MKVVVFSDVQANLPALREAVERIRAAQPDLVVMAGDLINRGPDSAGCLRLFDEQRRRHGWLPVQGNHETWVLRCGVEPPRSTGERDTRRFTDWTWAQIADQAEALRGWPDHLCFDAPAPNHWVHVTHGTLIGNRDGISPRTSDAALLDKLPADLDLFICGHTHIAHRRQALDMEIVNVGSVGSPFDRDERGSFGIFRFHRGRWHSEIQRFAYDRAQAQRDFETSGFLDQGGPLARLIFEEWKRADSLMGGWRRHYERAVLADEIDLGWSIDQYLAGID